MTQQVHQTSNSTSSTTNHFFTGSLLGLLLVIFLVAFFYGSFLFFRTARKILLASPQSHNFLASTQQDEGLQLIGGDSQQVPQSSNGVEHATAPKAAPQVDINSLWETQDPVNVLLLGIDQRPGEHGYFRTDTMILLHINPQTGDVGMISFPRDLWVEVPGYWETRINSAHVIGDAKQYPGGGPALAKKTVENLIGQPVDYYVRINFEGFRKLLEEIGCIDIDVPKLINDPTFPDDNYGYDPLYLEPGHYCMDADLALKYARTRHVDSDFGRMQRQQQVIMAIKDKVLSSGELPHLVSRAPTLLNILSDSVTTDMPLSKMIALANVARTLNLDNMRRLIIDVNMVEPTITEKGAAVLMPKMDLIRAAVDDFFASDNEAGKEGAVDTDFQPMPTESPIATSAAQQDVRVIVLNGTPKAGVEKTLSDILIAHGYNVVGAGRADRIDYTQTQIIAGESSQATRQLADLLGVSDQNIRLGAPEQLQADIVVIIGADFIMP